MPRRKKELSTQELLGRIDTAIRDPETKVPELLRLHSRRERLLKRMAEEPQVQTRNDPRPDDPPWGRDGGPCNPTHLGADYIPNRWRYVETLTGEERRKWYLMYRMEDAEREGEIKPKPEHEDVAPGMSREAVGKLLDDQYKSGQPQTPPPRAAIEFIPDI